MEQSSLGDYESRVMPSGFVKPGNGLRGLTFKVERTSRGDFPVYLKKRHNMVSEGAYRTKVKHIKGDVEVSFIVDNLDDIGRLK
eukprot:Nk52_evm68s352 gene=Nk52_evmTU68s352